MFVQSIRDFKINDMQPMKDDLRLVYSKVTHANESYLNLRKELGSLKSDIKKIDNNNGGF